MCGIAGLSSNENIVSEDLLIKMSESMLERGPDGLGIFTDGKNGLVHRRLSIIDLEGGKQPIFSNDERFVLVCNGEIYDHAKIRSQLQEEGHTFQTNSDSEIILQLYLKYGPECLQHLNGMFAFAILDRNTGRIFAGRDRLGQKPFFYAQEGTQFAFASGPDAILKLDWVDSSINITALHDFLECHYIPAPHSIHNGIKKLPAGHYLMWDGEELIIEEYFSPKKEEPFAGSYQEAQETCQNLLRESIDRRLVADVPLGAFLSGGLDSSIICALAKEQSDLKTFSIAFPDKNYDERQYAQEVANHLGTQHHFLEVKPDDFDLFRSLAKTYEEPFADSSMIPTFLLAKFTRQHVTVALSGDGADELFAGYNRYRVMEKFNKLDKIPQSLRELTNTIAQKVLPNAPDERSTSGRLRRLFKALSTNGFERYRSIISRFPEEKRFSLYNAEFRAALEKKHCTSLQHIRQRWQENTSIIQNLTELEISTYMNDDILTKVDRASMGNSLEVRSPFLDPKVVDFALSLPDHFKLLGKNRKRILADSFSQYLPANILTRPKMGFGLPMANWLRKEWRKPAEEALLNSPFLNAVFAKRELEKLWQNHQLGISDESYPITVLLSLSFWAELRNIKSIC